MIERIDEHDMTKNMMSIIRGGFKSKLLKESDMTESKVLDVQSNDAVFKDELKKLQAIYPLVKIKFFKIYPNEDNANVHMGVVFLEGEIGTVTGTDDPNKENGWMNEGNRSGVYFELNLIGGNYNEPIVKNVSNPELSNILKKLPGYYQNWVKEWGEKLQTDYVGRNN